MEVFPECLSVSSLWWVSRKSHDSAASSLWCFFNKAAMTSLVFLLWCYSNKTSDIQMFMWPLPFKLWSVDILQSGLTTVTSLVVIAGRSGQTVRVGKLMTSKNWMVWHLMLSSKNFKSTLFLNAKKPTSCWTGWSLMAVISFLGTADDEALPSACSTLIAQSPPSGRSLEFTAPGYMCPKHWPQDSRHSLLLEIRF